MPRAPTDPALPAGSPLESALEALLRGARVTAIPAVEGLELLTVARWLYRAWLAQQPRWQPLVHLKEVHLVGPGGDGALASSVVNARGGWLFLDRVERDSPLPGVLRAAAESGGLQLIHPAASADMTLPTGTTRRIAWLDRFHIPATDPTLSPVRAALRAHCRAGGKVLLRGPHGVGKRSVARWAHAMMDDAPLEVVTADAQTRPAPGRWTLYEEIERLSAQQLDELSRAVDTEAEYWREPPPIAEEATRPENPAFAAIRGSSAALAAVLQRADRYAPSALPILVRGPTGSGKELLARAVHEASGRPGRLVVIDLNAQSETLLESALFGHVRGAFTGADRDRLGAFREAKGGTLFLDELGNLSPGVQAKLLRALEQRAVQPVGSDQVIQVDVRIVAATNADLETMVRRGEFREDLLYRFNPSATLWLPALHERRDDILVLAEGFFAQARGRPAPEGWLDPAARSALLNWRWPGNIRELRHVMEAAAVEARGGRVLPAHLGALAPRASTPRPTVVTTAEPSSVEAREWHVRPSVRQTLLAVTVAVPGLAERGPLAAHNAVLAGLGGRPIAPEALAALARRPWWGQGQELAHVLRILSDLPPGEVGLDELLGVLPDMAIDAPAPPIVALLFPSALPDGSISGFKQYFSQGTVVVGRAHRLQDLRPAPGAPEREQTRWRALMDLIHNGEAGFLPMELVTRLSRAQLVVRLENDELVAHALPGSSPAAWAGAVGAPLDAVAPETPVSLGRAGVVEFRSDTQGPPLLRVFFFAGEVALAEHAANLLPRASPAATASFSGAIPGLPRPASSPESAQRAWILNAAERAALNALVCAAAVRGGAFAQVIRDGLNSLRDTDLAALARYLDSGHPTQSCTRLYSHEPNGALRGELSAVIRSHPDAADVWRRLPRGIRDGVRPPG